MRVLHDSHGRSVRYLRLSVTDRCNLRCLYCRSNARRRCIPHAQVLRYEEMARIVGIAAALGIGKVRLTGGEPFARKGCEAFLAMLRGRFPDMDLCVTTNGTLLEPYIPLLRRIKMSAVNLSLDSFDRATFARVTGRDMLPSVLSALDGLLAAGIRVKINVVAMRGANDGQMDDFVHAARNMPLDLRFIEFMPMGSGTLWSPENFWSADDIREEAARRARLIPVEADALGAEAESGPARMYRIEGGLGRMGFISPLTNHFCLICNRLRLTSEGALRTCLFADKEYRLRGMLRHPRITDEALAAVIRRACADKPVGADLLRARREGAAVAARQMVGIGG
ncbi:GTP 3',8-cyclase MoaA [uncultured Desulfovibrio sp.]|uniref:GTP 3',8-cyclase MoaA n=1 Tax=uncultured Desulfovibrio sp. TaxID=167968 RepID=UPI0003AA0CD0|nr:GTP 3',8-cyclase MoaA [uncultured Desulfovibrio sp.]